MIEIHHRRKLWIQGLLYAPVLLQYMLQCFRTECFLFFYNCSRIFLLVFQKCSSDFHCRARVAKLERVSTLQGVRIIEAIDACDCSPETSCRRESYIHYVHSGTPYQAVVDIGVCIGHCAKGINFVRTFRAVTKGDRWSSRDYLCVR